MTEVKPPGGVRRDGVAVVGMACRVPGARGTAGLWDLMIDGVDAITEGLPDRLGLDWSPVRDLPVQPRNDRWGGFLDGVEEFDAGFFGISDKAAVRMDPAQRLLLETVWEAVEDAGVRPSDLGGTRTGVYAAFAVSSEYWEMLLRSDLADLYSAVGSGSRACVAGQISHLLDLRGPSLALDAACAGSLLALHQASRALRDGEIDAALVCGVNLQLTPAYTLAFARGRLMSPSGACRFGDRDADGYARSEGVAGVLLKRESQAHADGDRIYAVIRGSGVSNDGRSGRSLVAASAGGQVEALRAAFRDAGVAPSEVDYVEAHGTGTPVGDHEELTALAEAIGRRRDPRRPCLVGSVKTNIGHTEAASGLLGLIKTALAIRHGIIPRSLYADRPQPLLTGGGLTAVPRNTAWPRHSGLRRAGVSSFGLSGTNVHVVLEEPGPDRWAAGVRIARRSLLGYALPLSARSPEALRETARGYERLLAGGARPADVCHSAAVRRDHYAVRSIAVAADRKGLVSSLRKIAAAPVPWPGPAAAPTRVVYLMTGEQPMTARTARALARSVRPFGLAAAECERRVRTAGGGLPAPGCWAQQVALASVWRHWGLGPDLVIGAGDGAYAAATVAGLPGAASFDDRTPELAAAGRGVGAGRSEAGAARLVAAWPARAAVNDPEAALRELAVPGGRTVLIVFGSAGPAAADLEREIKLSGGVAEVIDLHELVGRGDPLGLYTALGRAYTAGADPDWSRALPHGRFVDVPTSPWQRQRYWYTDALAAVPA